jgi:hypothetical protein
MEKDNEYKIPASLPLRKVISAFCLPLIYLHHVRYGRKEGERVSSMP